MPIDLSDAVTRSINLATAAGVPVDADSTPTWAVTLPDLTAGVSPAVQHGVTGEYYVLFTAATAGLHRDAWTAVVAGVTVTVRDVFTVEDPTRSAFISTAEALAHLRASGVIVSAADLEYLRWLCQVASEAVEDDLGRVIARRVVTETHDGGRAALALMATPVVSVTSVVESGTTLAAGDYTAGLSAGIVYRGGQQSPSSWAGGGQNVVVTYVAGFTTPPRIARKVALNGVQRMWQASQQMPHPAMDDIGAEAAIFAAVGTLTPLEMAAYQALRAPGMA